MTDIIPQEPGRRLDWPPLVEAITQAAPAPGRLYLVGGIVRDALRGGSSLDVDLTTPDDGLETARTIADRLGGAFYAVDPERRTGRIVLEHAQIDIASFRGETLHEDLLGRDFTVNAVAVRLDAPDLIYDPLGGADDLSRYRVIRQCSAHSIPDDPIRALRAVRQAVQFNLRIHPETLPQVRAAAPHLLDESGDLLQPERARDEFFKMLKGRPAASLRLLHALGLLEVLLPPTHADGATISDRTAAVERLHQLHTIISAQRDDNDAAQLVLGVAVMILDRYRAQLQEHLSYALAGDRPRAALLVLGALSRGVVPAELWADRLRLANAEREVLAGVDDAYDFDLLREPPYGARAIHRYYRALGESGVDGVLLHLAAYLHQSWPTVDPKLWGPLLEEVAAPLLQAFFRDYQQVVAPPPLLSGTDLMEALDLAPGPRVGQILSQLREEQAAGTITTREEALAFARTLTGE